MSILKRFFKDTIIYGSAIVLPRVINFLLVRLHTDVLPNEDYSENTEFYIVAAFFNVILTYGLETSFFRFFSRQKDKNLVMSTALISIIVSMLGVGVLLFIFRAGIANTSNINPEFYNLLIAITLVDTLVIVPFAYLRVIGKPSKFALLKLINVLIIVILNTAFLSKTYGLKSLQNAKIVNNAAEYIFSANLIASSFILVMVVPYMFKAKFKFDKQIFKQLMTYGLPVMIAELCFVINEKFKQVVITKI